MNDTINSLKSKVLQGGRITFDEALSLAAAQNHEDLFIAAEEITKHFGKPEFNPCSIINARSGKCSEDCKWCAQSAHYHTGADVHGIVSAEETLAQAKYNESKGVKRFSLVTSGKAATGKALDQICENYKQLRDQTRLFLCTSLGLLNRDELQKVWDSGVRRYHCNLETAPSYFGKLCTTHTIDDKINTLKAAREIGFEICCGGIIGMGETLEQRIELAFKLLEVQPDSIPINILSPIKGTPLADVPLIDEEDVLVTIAIFRFIHPSVELRFAGGRARLSRETQLKALR
ncbi:MAG: biotin synthase BioB, partial [Candidatus Cryptobacteroides sp.]